MAKKTNKKNKRGLNTPQQKETAVKTKIVATKSTRVTDNAKKSMQSDYSSTLAFGRQNYMWVGIGLALLAVGMLLMIGGYNENPAVWDESKIYGFQRTLLAPILILTGLGVQVYAIFK